MLNYDIFCARMQKCIKEKLNFLVYGRWYGNTIKLLTSYFFVVICFEPMLNGIVIFLLFLLLMALYVYLATRKAGLGLGEDCLLYVKFKHFGSKVKLSEKIDVGNIKSINFKKVWNFNILSMSYINDEGRLKQIYFYYTDIILGFNINEQKKNAKEITERLRAVQKVLDKGDF